MTAKEEYFFLTDRLDKLEWAIKGDCDDVDCDKYLFRYMFKKKYKPILEHNFSCMRNLKREREAFLRILSQKRYRKFRYKKCKACGKKLDELDDKRTILISFTKPCEYNGKKCSQWRCERVHRRCRKKFIIPKGWKKGF